MDNVKFNQTLDEEKSSTFNVEAEQALLGLLLVNSEVLGEIETIIGEDHFYDGINRKIFTFLTTSVCFLLSPRIKTQPELCERFITCHKAGLC